MRGSKSTEVSENEKIKIRKENALELSGKGLQNMSSLPKGRSVFELVLDNNSITKIEMLDAFPKLTSLSMVGNNLVRMNGVNFAKNLMSVNLSNNGIVSMEGLCWLVHLEFLNLSKNNIKCIQNVSYCTKLKHMDLSENSITEISNLKSLVQLQVLLLHGNSITTLERVEVKLPEQIETLSLSGNGFSDLNEICRLSCLSNLKHFSIQDNPCVMNPSLLPGFQSRPFIISCLPFLMTLDGCTVAGSERHEAERLSEDKNLPLFSIGHHLELVLYLSKICPVSETNQDGQHPNHDALLEEFLRKRRLEAFGEQKNEKVSFPLNNNVHNFESYSMMHFSENTENGSGNFSPDEESEGDTLRSESRFLPVYSPLKKSSEKYQTTASWEPPLLNFAEDMPSKTGGIPSASEDIPSVHDDATDTSEELPIMTEEEANKLINLAATILQSHIRGFLARRKFDYRVYKRVNVAACKIQALWKGYYFRRYSQEGINFKNEIRTSRVQKYISTLCVLMQTSQKQNEIEKQQMLEVISLLYKQLAQLSEKVQELESSSEDSKQTARNDESIKYLDQSVHPVFAPHPRFVRDIEHSENKVDIDHLSMRRFPLSEESEFDLDVDDVPKDVIEQSDSMNNKLDDKTSDYVLISQTKSAYHLGLEELSRDTMKKQLSSRNEQYHSEWHGAAQNKIQEDNAVDQDALHRDKELEANCSLSVDCSADYNEGVITVNGGTDEDSDVPKRSDVELYQDILHDFTGAGVMSSEVTFMNADVCELLKSTELDQDREYVEPALLETGRLNGDSENKMEGQNLDVVGHGLKSLIGKDGQGELDNQLDEQFDNGQFSNIQNNQQFSLTESDSDKAVDDNEFNDEQIAQHQDETSLNTEPEILKEFRETISPDLTLIQNSENGDNIKEDFSSTNVVTNLTFDISGSFEHFGEVVPHDKGFPRNCDASVQPTRHSEFESVENRNTIEGTTEKRAEETRLSLPSKTIVPELTSTHSHDGIEKGCNGGTDSHNDEVMAVSMQMSEQICSHPDKTVVVVGDKMSGEAVVCSNDDCVDVESTNVMNVDGGIGLSRESNIGVNADYEIKKAERKHESSDGLQDDNTRVLHSNAIETNNTMKEGIKNEQETAMNNSEEDLFQMNKASPQLRETASLLLSALKDEITGDHGNNIEQEKSPVPTHTSHGNSGLTTDTKADTTSDLSTSGSHNTGK